MKVTEKILTTNIIGNFVAHKIVEVLASYLLTYLSAVLTQAGFGCLDNERFAIVDALLPPFSNYLRLASLHFLLRNRSIFCEASPSYELQSCCNWY